MNKMYLTTKGQYAAEWLTIYKWIILACIFVGMIAKLFSPPLESPVGSTPPLAGGYIQCAEELWLGVK